MWGHGGDATDETALLGDPPGEEEAAGMKGGGNRAEEQGGGQLYQLEEVLPIVLCHEAEESQEGPAEGVIAGVAVVGVPPSLHALVTLGAMPGERMGAAFREA